MQRDVQLSGGPLAGFRWPVRLEADKTLWIGIGADGVEYDGRSRLKAIAIYQRAGSDESPRFDFARLEGPGARIAELGRRITRLRADWAGQRRAAANPAHAIAPPAGNQPTPTIARPVAERFDAARIAGRVFARWLSAVESMRSQPVVDVGWTRITLFVPGEAEQFADLLQRHGIAAELIQTKTEVRSPDSGAVELLETGAVEIRATDLEGVADLLRGSVDVVSAVQGP